MVNLASIFLIMNPLQRVALIVLSVFTGLVFVYSAYTKLFPGIQSFEYTIVEFTHIPLLFSRVVARLFIGLEASLGFLMTIHFFGRGKWVLKTALGLLVLFSLFLVYMLVSVGDNVNCGCFGDSIFMRPSVSLLKNAVLIAVLVLLLKKAQGFNYRWVYVTAPLVVVATLATLYIALPVYEVYKLNLKPLYKDKKWAPATDLTHGKYIVAFLSPSCGHCRKAAQRMHQMKEKNLALPFYMIIGGVESDLTSFWNDTHAVDIHYTRLNTHF